MRRSIWALLTSHWIGLLGAALVTTAAFSWLFVLPLHMRGNTENPYIGLLIFVLIPVVFFTGLTLIPIGMFLARRRIKAGLAAEQNRATTYRRLAVFFGIMTFLNVVLGSQLTYKSVQYLETKQFCGQSCHVMKPEFTAFQIGSHQKVGCAECHIAPGAPGWVKAKMSGTRQLFEVILNNYPRPIPSAIESNRLAPAGETCESCHARDRVTPVRIKIFNKYKDDEANTPTKTVLSMNVRGGMSGGIHGAHLGPGVMIRYAAKDAKRQQIPWIEYRNTAAGQTRTYIAGDAKGMTIFEMQCTDCHNRPAHSFETPEAAMDRVLTAGAAPTTLPYLKKTGVELLKASYSTDDQAARRIPQSLANYYLGKYPDVASSRAGEIARAGQAVLAVYRQNVFPDLRVGWGTYVNNLGHTDAPGCFRCHDDAHLTAAKKTITQDCNTCHQALAVEESSPEILKTIGLSN